ncbi:MAG: hypothetical protein DRH04_10830 [Deltaproteobacteria bacterium]|nr:MAG: hypothetical protein DRH04_10830 [Deltaproteobacteria bacterium]
MLVNNTNTVELKCCFCECVIGAIDLTLREKIKTVRITKGDVKSAINVSKEGISGMNPVAIICPNCRSITIAQIIQDNEEVE